MPREELVKWNPDIVETFREVFFNKLRAMREFYKLCKVIKLGREGGKQFHHHFMLSLYFSMSSPSAGFLKTNRCSCAIR
jgi:hypothetical protein